MNESVTLRGADIFNAIPVPAFLVDDDVRILDLNDAASKSFDLLKPAVHMRRGGEVLHCLHAHDVPEGCGKGPACRKCVIRNTVIESLKGVTVTRRRMIYERAVESGKKELELMISASPVIASQQTATLLMVEDISEITKLRSIVPICSQCKRIRNDAQYWQQVESYFHDYIGVDFSHGMCPECLQQFYGEYIDKKPVS